MSHFCAKSRGMAEIACYESEGLNVRWREGLHMTFMPVSFCPFCGFTLDKEGRVKQLQQEIAELHRGDHDEPTASKLAHEAQPTRGEAMESRLDDIEQHCKSTVKLMAALGDEFEQRVGRIERALSRFANLTSGIDR